MVFAPPTPLASALPGPVAPATLLPDTPFTPAELRVLEQLDLLSLDRNAQAREVLKEELEAAGKDDAFVTKAVAAAAQQPDQRTAPESRGLGVSPSRLKRLVDPFQPGPDADRHGVPATYGADRYPYAFGGDGSGTGMDYREPVAFLDILTELGIELVCITVGSPYYNPHIQRPAYFPPSDGYQLLEDPLVGVARQIEVVAALKRQRPDLLYVGSGYSYLQDWFPNVAQAAVRTGLTDLVGIGRMVLSYPDICADIISGKHLQRKQICRTFSDCTTAPRNGLISGCYPLDPWYKERPEAEELKRVKG